MISDGCQFKLFYQIITNNNTFVHLKKKSNALPDCMPLIYPTSTIKSNYSQKKKIRVKQETCDTKKICLNVVCCLLLSASVRCRLDTVFLRISFGINQLMWKCNETALDCNFIHHSLSNLIIVLRTICALGNIRDLICE